MRKSKTLQILGASAAISFGLQAVAAPVSAQTYCADRTKVVSELKQINAEAPTAIGLSDSGILIELLVSPSGDWTILGTDPDREACVLAIGEHWESVPIAVARPEA